MHTACVWSEKLPFAGYSVDKDHRRFGPWPARQLGRSRGPKSPAPLPRILALRGKYRPAEFFRLSRGAFPRTPFKVHSASASPSRFGAHSRGRNTPLRWHRCHLSNTAWRAAGFNGPSEPANAQCARCNQSGEYRARTGDLLVANQALSQLS
jgi:hypothetical protein